MLTHSSAGKFANTGYCYRLGLLAELLVTSTTDEVWRHAPKQRGVGGGNTTDDAAATRAADVNEQELNQLATHLPDMILNMNLSVNPPFVRQFSGVIMFLDISGMGSLGRLSVCLGSKTHKQPVPGIGMCW